MVKCIFYFLFENFYHKMHVYLEIKIQEVGWISMIT